tara:strand:+ start:801 stop:1019 length:219 start_codon:yes stop_codon:yes gene_type:complete
VDSRLNLGRHHDGGSHIDSVGCVLVCWFVDGLEGRPEKSFQFFIRGVTGVQNLTHFSFSYSFLDIALISWIG